MPFYTYKCNKCDSVFESFTRSISSPEKPVCKNNKCKSKDCERFYNETPAVHYKKGSGGFYSKDYEDTKEKMKYLSGD